MEDLLRTRMSHHLRARPNASRLPSRPHTSPTWKSRHLPNPAIDKTPPRPRGRHHRLAVSTVTSCGQAYRMASAPRGHCLVAATAPPPHSNPSTVRPSRAGRGLCAGVTAPRNPQWPTATLRPLPSFRRARVATVPPSLCHQQPAAAAPPLPRHQCTATAQLPPPHHLPTVSPRRHRAATTPSPPRHRPATTPSPPRPCPADRAPPPSCHHPPPWPTPNRSYPAL